MFSTKILEIVEETWQLCS